MNDTELLLLKEAFRNILKEEIPKLVKEELDSLRKGSAKDLKEIKLLVAKQITEGRKMNEAGGGQLLSENTKSRLGEVFSRSNRMPRTPLESKVQQGLSGVVAAAPLKNILMETAGEMSGATISDMGPGEFSDDPRWGGAPEQSQNISQDFGEMDDYESPMPDFMQDLVSNFNR